MEIFLNWPTLLILNLIDMKMAHIRLFFIVPSVDLSLHLNCLTSPIAKSFYLTKKFVPHTDNVC